MILAFGDVGHFLHGPAIGEYVPLAPQALVTEEIEEPLRAHRQPDGGGGAEDDPRWLAGIVDALPGHDLDVVVDVLRPELVPLVKGRGAYSGAEVVGHSLG